MAYTSVAASSSDKTYDLQDMSIPKIDRMQGSRGRAAPEGHSNISGYSEAGLTSPQLSLGKTKRDVMASTYFHTAVPSHHSSSPSQLIIVIGPRQSVCLVEHLGVSYDKSIPFVSKLRPPMHSVLCLLLQLPEFLLSFKSSSIRILCVEN
uniref:Uncharacterized protein n=1 Tax=Timema bartmani TaxID=61472 RepID=A0A7R9HXU0_9NEOP|nr:unnamed protein product [Timema bartmani]